MLELMAHNTFRTANFLQITAFEALALPLLQLWLVEASFGQILAFEALAVPNGIHLYIFIYIYTYTLECVCVCVCVLKVCLRFCR
jgi:hypothetical protein